MSKMSERNANPVGNLNTHTLSLSFSLSLSLSLSLTFYLFLFTPLTHTLKHKKSEIDIFYALKCHLSLSRTSLLEEKKYFFVRFLT